MASDRIRQLHTLAHQHQPHAVKDQCSLLLAGLDLDKAHGGPSHRLTDRLGTAASFFCRLT
jgi:hypothetical protein